MEKTKREQLEELTHEQLILWALDIWTSLDMSDAVLRLIPPCPEHGENCLSYAKEWILKQRANAADQE